VIEVSVAWSLGAFAYVPRFDNNIQKQLTVHSVCVNDAH